MAKPSEQFRKTTNEELTGLRRQIQSVNQSLQDQVMLRNNLLTRARYLSDQLDQLDQGLMPPDLRDLTPWEQ